MPVIFQLTDVHVCDQAITIADACERAHTKHQPPLVASKPFLVPGQVDLHAIVVVFARFVARNLSRFLRLMLTLKVGTSSLSTS